MQNIANIVFSHIIGIAKINWGGIFVLLCVIQSNTMTYAFSYFISVLILLVQVHTRI
jgi:hypothetical protein